MQDIIDAYHLHRVKFNVSSTGPFNYLTGSTGFPPKAWGNDGLQESNPLTLKGLVRRERQGGLFFAGATPPTSPRPPTNRPSPLTPIFLGFFSFPFEFPPFSSL